MTSLDWFPAVELKTTTRTVLRVIATIAALAALGWSIVDWPPECSTDPGPKIGNAILITGCTR